MAQRQREVRLPAFGAAMVKWREKRGWRTIPQAVNALKGKFKIEVSPGRLQHWEYGWTLEPEEGVLRRVLDAYGAPVEEVLALLRADQAAYLSRATTRSAARLTSRMGTSHAGPDLSPHPAMVGDKEGTMDDDVLVTLARYIASQINRLPNTSRELARDEMRAELQRSAETVLERFRHATTGTDEVAQ